MSGGEPGKEIGREMRQYLSKSRYYDDGDIRNMIDRQERKASRQRKVQRKRQRRGREKEERGRINLGGIY